MKTAEDNEGEGDGGGDAMMRSNEQHYHQRFGVALRCHPRRFFPVPGIPSTQRHGGHHPTFPHLEAMMRPNNQHYYSVNAPQRFGVSSNNCDVAAKGYQHPFTHPVPAIPSTQPTGPHRTPTGIPYWKTLANGYSLPHVSNNSGKKQADSSLPRPQRVKLSIGAGEENIVNSAITAPHVLAADPDPIKGNKSRSGRERKAPTMYTYDDPRDVKATGERQRTKKPATSGRDKIKNLMTNSKRSVITQGRMFSIAKTPSKLGSKRKREIAAAMSDAFEYTCRTMLPAMHTPGKAEVVSRAASYLFDKGNQEYKMLRDKAKIAEHLIHETMKMKPEKRRHVMAFLAGQNKSRNGMMDLMGLNSEEGGEGATKEKWKHNISSYEWQRAKKQLSDHGPLVPVPKPMFPRVRFKRKDVEMFLGWLSDKGFVQNHAYGSKSHQFRSGAMLRADKVSLTSDKRTILKEYAVDFLERDVDVENRCERRYIKNQQQCFLEKGHESKCDFTGGGGLCADSIEKIMGVAFKGELKCRAGLDDEDVTRGHDNIKRCIEILKEVAKDDEQVKEMTAKLLKINEWTKTGYKQHLESEGVMQCQCIECGLRTTAYCVPCRKHEKNEHRGPCQGCMDCFNTMDELLAMVKRARDLELGEPSDKSQIEVSNNEVSTVAMDVIADEDFDRLWEEAVAEAEARKFSREFDVKEENSQPDAAANKTETAEATRFRQKELLTFEVKAEKFNELIADVMVAVNNLKRHRSHTARKKIEADASRKRMNTLQPNEAIVVADFKQKILQAYFRENQLKYFAKRGISCLGFMILTRPQCDDESETPDEYLDASFILLFSNETTQDALFINAAKNYIYNEVLDTKFSGLETPIQVKYVSDGAGAFNCNVAKACMPYWHSWTDGKVEEIEVRVSVSGDGKTALDGLFGVFTAKMSQSIANQNGDITDAESLLSNFEASGGIKGTKALVFSPCREKPFDTNEKRLKQYHHLVLNRKENAIRCRFTTDVGEGINIHLESIAKGWTHPPTAPDYIIHEQATATIKSEQNAACHTESFQNRQETKITSRVERKNAEFEKKREEESKRMSGKEDEKDRTFWCNEQNRSGTQYCMCQFRSEKALRNHQESGDHRFPAQNLIDTAFEVAAGDRTMFQLGSRMNRSDAMIGSEESEVVEDESGKHSDAFAPGCILKHGRADPYHFKPELKKILTGWYDEGEAETGSKAKKSKWTAEVAQKTLRKMTQSNGKLMFSSTSQFGHVPEVKQIKSFFAGIKEKRRKQAERELSIASGKEPTKAGVISKKKRIDTNAPKNARTAYTFFKASKQAEVQANHAGENVAEVLRTMWQGLCDADKAPWNKLAEEDKTRYDDEWDNYTPPSDNTCTKTNEKAMKKANAGGKRKASKSGGRKMPTQPRSAAAYFQQAKRGEFKVANPHASSAEITKLLCSAWKQLNSGDKVEYKEKAKEDKKRYEEDMKRYRKETEDCTLTSSDDDDSDDDGGKKKAKRTKKDPNAPKKPLNAYLLYANSVRAQIREENPDMSMTEVSQEISKKYKSLGEEEKAKWQVEASEAMNHYREEVAVIDLVNTPDDNNEKEGIPVLKFPFKATDEVFTKASSKLTELKRASVNHLRSASLSENRVRDPVTLTEETVARLEPTRWLDDSLINFWLKWISGEPNHPASDVLVMSSYFLSLLVRDGPGAVSNWYSSADIFHKKLILLPLHADNHWSLCAIVNPGCVVNKVGAEKSVSDSSEAASFLLLLDSYDLHLKRMNGFAAHIYKWLNYELQNNRDGDVFSTFSRNTMPVLAPDIPKQDNAYDCGVFVCRYAYNLLQMRDECFSRSDLNEECTTLITSNVLFDFTMNDIARIRSEFKDLIDKLGEVWLHSS